MNGGRKGPFKKSQGLGTSGLGLEDDSPELIVEAWKRGGIRKAEGLGPGVQMFPPSLDFSRSARRLSTGYGGQAGS
jgi:hypothetical protein